ncbi:hypothetical protein A0J48_016130 [Sphaerospermopsis aphanizomenoides BCCUSP55]|uniref:hypothetical protein n=1 Tax=Sphaerospermopsis aphanizomenoides TaxID=459663 RepID=UPI001905CAA4|nr:hypothetical protein [Sphaerospermopsis aphanizomenoides]MBK1989049.1 hypothetical protein [Sphaerospermopsis aphanizomenoides BCCUSP55]
MSIGANILELVIIPGLDICSAAALDLVERLEAANLAQQRLLEGFISLEDYFDILELCGVDMDQYLGVVEQNVFDCGFV